MVRAMPLVDRLSTLTKLLPIPKLDGGRNLIRQAWDLLSVMPGGKLVFSIRGRREWFVLRVQPAACQTTERG